MIFFRVKGLPKINLGALTALKCERKPMLAGEFSAENQFNKRSLCLCRGFITIIFYKGFEKMCLKKIKHTRKRSEVDHTYPLLEEE